MLYLLLGVTILLGAMAQRVAGMGFALVGGPVLVLLLGPFDGVLMMNICGATSALLIVTRLWNDIDWKRYALLVLPALAGIVPGVLLSVLLGGDLLQTAVAVILLVALTVSLRVARLTWIAPPVRTGVIAGLASGFMSATAGTSGPGMSVYAVLTRWEHRGFAATIQPFFVTLGVVSFFSKILVSGDGLPDYGPWLWMFLIACTLGGLAVGEWVARVISARVARRAVIIIAYVGGVVMLVDGVLALIATGPVT